MDLTTRTKLVFSTFLPVAHFIDRTAKIGMKTTLDSKYGTIRRLKNNPRTISDAAFTRLCESIERDPEFMSTRRIIVDENNEVLGGNQRFAALLDLGYERIPDEWITQVTGWSDEKKKRFILVDNSPAGVSGDFDYESLEEFFPLDILVDAGIDMSLVGEEKQEEQFATSEERAEKAKLYGEKDEALKGYIHRREKGREAVGAISDLGFYLCVVFQSTAQKNEFLEKAGLESEGGIFASGLDLASAVGVELAEEDNDFPERTENPALSALALDNPQEPTRPTSVTAGTEG